MDPLGGGLLSGGDPRSSVGECVLKFSVRGRDVGACLLDHGRGLSTCLVHLGGSFGSAGVAIGDRVLGRAFGQGLVLDRTRQLTASGQRLVLGFCRCGAGRVDLGLCFGPDAGDLGDSGVRIP
ncbi:hypothetical protein IU469_34605, partial [Nocardia puris]|uniref:hypothetical protein n=1 Tax=Nocardia puris TaxID=208602 RepID=UPI00189486BD